MSSSAFPEPPPGVPPDAARHQRLALEQTLYVLAAADRLGMGIGEWTCLSALWIDGPVTAGALAQRTGLTTGAITGIVDRLERGGWVRREADPADRRRVIVGPVRSRLADLQPVLAPAQADAAALLAALDDQGRAAVGRWEEDWSAVLARHTAELRRRQEVVAEAGRVTVPREGRSEARLRLVCQAGQLRLGAAALDGDLCVVESASGTPAVSVTGSTVEVDVRPLRRLRRASSQGGITLATGVHWAVEVVGNASDLEVDLAQATLGSLEVSGGASSIRLSLPQPSGAVRIGLRGGASDFRIARPAGVAVGVQLRGRGLGVTLDGSTLRHSVALGEADGYAVEVTGAASSVRIGT